MHRPRAGWAASRAPGWGGRRGAAGAGGSPAGGRRPRAAAAAGTGTEAGTGRGDGAAARVRPPQVAAGAWGSCSGRLAAGSRRGVVIYGLPAAVRHWEAEGAVLRSPICYGGKQTRESALNRPRSRLGRPLSVLGSCGSGAQVRSGETLCGSGQRSAGSGRAAACGLRGTPALLFVSVGWILKVTPIFPGGYNPCALKILGVFSFWLFSVSFRMISIAFCLVSWKMQLSVL